MAKMLGDKDLDARMSKMAKGNDITPALLMVAERTRGRYGDKLDEPSPGRKVTRYNPRREVTAAGAGHAPNTDTGYLKNSAGVAAIGPNKVELFVSAEYAQYLELGTSKMAPRPALGPAFEETKEDAIAAIAKIVGEKL